MNAITTTSGALVPSDMRGAMDLASMMCKGKLVPAHLRDSPGDCLMVIEQAMRWGMSPFAVAQSTSVVQGKLMFEGKLVSAALHASGIMSTRLRETFEGDGDSRAIVLIGTLKGETEPRSIRVTLKEARTTNGMWTKQPDQQLVYFATRAWARRHAPEVMLGVYSPEEFDEPKPRDTFAGPTLDAKPEPAAEAPPPPRKQTAREFLDALQADLYGAETADEVDAIVARPDVQRALEALRNGAKAALDEMISVALNRTSPTGDDRFMNGEHEPIDNDPANGGGK